MVRTLGSSSKSGPLWMKIQRELPRSYFGEGQLRDRIWWGSASNGTSEWAATLGMNLQSSTLKEDESGEPLHVQQRRQIATYREAWKQAGHQHAPRVSVSRSIFPLVDGRDRTYFG